MYFLVNPVPLKLNSSIYICLSHTYTIKSQKYLLQSSKHLKTYIKTVGVMYVLNFYLLQILFPSKHKFSWISRCSIMAELPERQPVKSVKIMCNWKVSDCHDPQVVTLYVVCCVTHMAGIILVADFGWLQFAFCRYFFGDVLDCHSMGTFNLECGISFEMEAWDRDSLMALKCHYLLHLMKLFLQDLS